ncbi:MAG: peptidoglycan-binding protein [Alicyclobacillaceae bacterium]|nr:peptidoglycan-binding protein [Alicyclobacillaceae bacterium]
MAKRRHIALCMALMSLSMAPIGTQVVSAQSSPPVIQEGARGSAVAELQKALNERGFAAGPVDGIFGPQTAAAVAAFQRAHGLAPSGVATAATWALLLGTSGSASSAPAQISRPPAAPVSKGRTTSGPAVSNLRQVTISFQGKVVSRPYAFTANGTTYVPIWYLMNMLKSIGVQSSWNGRTWALTLPKGTSVDFSNIRLAAGSHVITMNGKPVARVTGIPYPDPYTHRETTFMPIWYLQQALRRIGIQYEWDGRHWTMTRSNPNLYASYRSDGTLIGRFPTLADAEKALAGDPGGVVKDANGNIVYTAQPPVTYTAYGPDGSTLGTYNSLQDAKSAVAAMPGASVVDSSGKLVYTQPVAYVALGSDGRVRGLYASLADAQAAIIDDPGATVENAAGQVVYTQPAATPVFSAYSQTGALLGTYVRLSDAEDALANNPGGTVTDSTGKVVFTEPAAPVYTAFTARGQLLGTYQDRAAAINAVSSSPGATVKDTAGNVLYIQPLAAYTAFSPSGAILGVYSSLSVAEQALAGTPGGTVKDPSGEVVYTQPSQPSGGQGSGGSQPGPSFTNVDLRYPAPANITASVIDQYLRAHNSPLAGLGSVFIQAQNLYGVNANYLVSHAILETGWGKSQIARAKNNLFGYGAFDSNPGVDAGTFPSDAYAILFEAWEVRQNYLTPGSSLYVSPTLAGMNVHYATDPHWAASIGALMGQLAAYVGDSVTSYRQYAPSNQPPNPALTAEPVFRLNGAAAVVQPTPNYGGLPYYSTWSYGSSHMFVRTLQNGTAGGDVATLQQALNQVNHAGLVVDGVFGPLTAAALKQYQSKAGLPATGVCDYNTWKSLIPPPATVIPAGTKVTVDQVEQGMAGGLVTEWYHVVNYGWVNANFIQFTNVYRLTVSNPLSPSAVNIPVYKPGNPNTVLTTMHAGDWVVAADTDPVNGYITIQFVDQNSGQAQQGWVSAAQVTLTPVR